MTDPVQDNRLCWDDLVPAHVHSGHYDVPGFLQGRSSLDPLTLDVLPPLDGATVLHLQCHFGLDTLSMWRAGATVTGLDFSPAAIHAANTLTEAIGADATFVEADVANTRQALNNQLFDVVFTSWGVVMWLPDLSAWAEQIAKSLRPGGSFHMVEVHPLLWSCIDSTTELTLGVNYLGGVRRTESIQGSYADPDAVLEHPLQHTWQHGLGEIVTALLGAGLQLERLTEHEAVSNQALSMLTQSKDGLWRLPDGYPRVPLAFSIVARR